MRQANDFNYKSVASVQRASVNLLRFDQTRFPMPNGHMLRITAVVENSGTTPAVPAINYVNVAKSPTELDERTFRGNDTHFIAGTIGPKATPGLTELDEPESFLMGKDLGDLSQPPLMIEPYNHLFVFGWVAYNDIFGSPHVTEFCEETFNVDIDRKAQTVKLDLSNCDSHNCTDDYCADYKELEALIPKKPS